MNSKESLYCSTCSKEFKRKTCFDKHISICGVLNNKSIDFVPSNREIYMLFVDLSKKYDQLDKKYNTLQNKYNQLTVKNKITPIDYLNKNVNCDKNFDQLSNIINITRENVDYIIKNDFNSSVCFILIQLITTENVTCIQCFEEKKDIIYIYHGNWSQLNVALLKNLISTIRQKIFIAFKSYVDENKEKLYDESFSTVYAETMKKLTSENEKETRIIKNKFYRDFPCKLNIL